MAIEYDCHRLAGSPSSADVESYAFPLLPDGKQARAYRFRDDLFCPLCGYYAAKNTCFPAPLLPVDGKDILPGARCKDCQKWL